MVRKEKKKNWKNQCPEFFVDSYWASKFIEKLIQRGRKKAVLEIVWDVFKKFKMESHKDPLKFLFFSFVKNRPLLELAPIRISREIKKVPLPLSPRRQLIVSLTWTILALKLIRYREKNLPLKEILYTQLKAVMNKEKTLFTIRRNNHIQELIENRVNLNFRKKLKR